MHLMDIAVKSCVVDVSGTPSHLLMVGCELSDLSSLPKLVLVIPGNPGCADFYAHFAQHLFVQSGHTPIVVISHAFHQHSTLRNTWSSRLMLSDVFTLEQQVQHKLDFVEQFLHRKAKLILVGHSIGAYMCLKLMQHCDHSGSLDVQHGFLMMPVFERMRESPEAHRMICIIKYLRYLVLFLHAILTTVIPLSVLSLILSLFKSPSEMKFVKLGLQSVVHTRCLCNVLFMASDELDTVNSLDVRMVTQSLAKTTFYYTPGDGWAPQHYAEQFSDRVPGANVVIGQEGFKHQFLDRNSAQVAQLICKWASKLKLLPPL